MYPLQVAVGPSKPGGFNLSAKWLQTGRPSKPYGLMIIPVLTAGQDPSDGYNGCTVTVSQQVSQPFTQQQQVEKTDTFDVLDNTYFKFCSPSKIIIDNPTQEQTYNVYITEQDQDDIVPGSFGAGSGGGVLPASGVTITEQTTATGYTPTSAADGASTKGASGLRINLVPDVGTWVDGQPLLAWRGLVGGTIWIRCPGLDQSVPAGSAALGAGAVATIGLADQTFSVGSDERIALIASAGAIVGAAAVATFYEVQA